MSFRTEIVAAIRAWGSGVFRSRSAASTTAVRLLNRILTEDAHDDRRLIEVVEYLTNDYLVVPPAFAGDLAKPGATLKAQLVAAIGRAGGLPRGGGAAAVVRGGAAAVARGGGAAAVARGAGAPPPAVVVRPAPPIPPRPVVAGAAAVAAAAAPRAAVVVAAAAPPFNFALLRRFERDWGEIEITDRPIGAHGRYAHTVHEPARVMALGAAAAAAIAQERRAGAGAGGGGGAAADAGRGDASGATKLPDFWMKLGRVVHVGAPVDGGRRKKVAACQGCAGAVIYSLVMDATFDELVIRSMGTADYDHHYVLVGRPAEMTAFDRGAAADVVAIDIWQANVDGRSPQWMPFREFRYGDGRRTMFCELLTADRAALRAASAS